MIQKKNILPFDYNILEILFLNAYYSVGYQNYPNIKKLNILCNFMYSN